MSRQLRIEFPGALYHVMTRGNNRERIVQDETDAAAFLDSLQSTCRRYAWQVFAWCVMPNHYHLVVETIRSTLSHGMRRHNSTYAQYYNKRHGRIGHVFQGRYKALLVAKERYLLTVLRYVELNPCRAALVRHPADWPWSSARVSLGTSTPPAWSAVREVWARFGGSDAENLTRYREFLDDGMRLQSTPFPVRSSLVIGDESDAARIHERAGDIACAEIPVAQRAIQPSLESIFVPTRDTDEAIKEAYLAGFSLRAIAEYLGVHYTTVSSIARRTTARKRGSTTGFRAATKPLCHRTGS